MIANSLSIALIVAIAGCGSVFAWIFRRQPRKVVNIALLTIGLALLTYSHLEWAIRHESPDVKQAMFIRHVIAGWVMVAMGFVGLQCGPGHTKGDG